MSRRDRWARAGLILWAGCGKTAECERLEALVVQRTEILNTARTRAALAGRLEKKATAAQARAERRLEELGLDGSEAALDRVLQRRSRAVAGEIRRTTVPGGAEGARSGWRVVFPARSWSEARAELRRLERSPPLFRFAGMWPAPAGRFEVELGRVRVPRVPLDAIRPQPLPGRSSVDRVSSELGFCGASDLRAHLAALDAQIDGLAEQAGRTTQYLPLSASWDGVTRRAELAVRVEHEARRVRDQLLGAARKAGLRVRAVGGHTGAVVIELRAANRDQGRLERSLVPGLLPRVRFEREARRGVLRVVVSSRAAVSGPRERR